MATHVIVHPRDRPDAIAAAVCVVVGVVVWLVWARATLLILGGLFAGTLAISRRTAMSTATTGTPGQGSATTGRVADRLSASVRAMPANLASFALHVDDVDRARAFYEAVFGWQFEPWGPPGFYLIHTGDEASPGIQGLMHKRQEPRSGTGLNGVEPTFSVRDVDAVAEAVEANGGRVTMTKAAIPTVGALIRFLDTENNDIGAMQYETPPHT